MNVGVHSFYCLLEKKDISFIHKFCNKEKVPKVIIFIMSRGCPSFLNKTKVKEYSKQLRSYNHKN